MAVVDDLLADVDGRTVYLQGTLDHLDRPFDPGAEGPWFGEQHLARPDRHRPPFEHRPEGRHRPQPGDPTAGQIETSQRLFGRVDDDAHDGQRHSVRARSDLCRLHVDGDRAGGRELRARSADRKPRHRHDRADVHGQSRPPQLTGEQGRGQAASADRTVGGAHLIGHHHVPGFHPRAETATETDQGDRVGLCLPDDAGGPAGVLRPHTRADEDRARGQARAGRGPRLQPQRCGDDQARTPPEGGRALRRGCAGRPGRPGRPGWGGVGRGNLHRGLRGYRGRFGGRHRGGLRQRIRRRYH